MLLHRSQVRAALGISDDALRAMVVELKTGEEEVAFGKIGAVRGLSYSRKGKRKGNGYLLYRRTDVGRIIGKEFV